MAITPVLMNPILYRVPVPFLVLLLCVLLDQLIDSINPQNPIVQPNQQAIAVCKHRFDLGLVPRLELDERSGREGCQHRVMNGMGP